MSEPIKSKWPNTTSGLSVTIQRDVADSLTWAQYFRVGTINAIAWTQRICGHGRMPMALLGPINALGRAADVQGSANCIWSNRYQQLLLGPLMISDVRLRSKVGPLHLQQLFPMASPGPID